MALITTEMLFEDNVLQIIKLLKNNYISQNDFDGKQGLYPDLLTWMELNPEAVGRVFTAYLINYGFTNEDIQ